jgi:hypothetical protein
MKYKQYVRYAIYAAEQVIDIYEKEYPKDNRPREAIKAAKKCLINPNKKNKLAAELAAESAWSAARSAWSAAELAAGSAWSAAWSAWLAAESAAWLAAGSAAWSATEPKRIKLKILKYGMKLLR